MSYDTFFVRLDMGAYVQSQLVLIRLPLVTAAYCVVAVESAGRELPIAFLERVKDEFYKKYGTGKGKTATAKSLNKEFGYVPIYAQIF